MNLLNIFLIALAVAMDAFAVSVASGIAIRQLKIKHALTIATWFGLFQAVMPLIGWLGGLNLKAFIGGVDHWVASSLLCIVGCKMICESFKMKSDEDRANALEVPVLFMLSLATSIDALAAGISFAMLAVAIAGPILVIGTVTFVMCLAGVWIGNRIGHFFERIMEIAGGLLLVAMGIKVLISHLAFP